VRDVRKNHPDELDAVAAWLQGADPREIGYLRLASETFSAWDENAVSKAIEFYSQVFANGR
jgi:hypothetical protein